MRDIPLFICGAHGCGLTTIDMDEIEAHLILACERVRNVPCLRCKGCRGALVSKGEAIRRSARDGFLHEEAPRLFDALRAWEAKAALRQGKAPRAAGGNKR